MEKLKSKATRRVKDIRRLQDAGKGYSQEQSKR
jgi:hypothetical protein